MELIGQIPFGLVGCRLNGESVTITGLSDRQVRLRLAEEVVPESLSFSFLQIGTARRVEISPKNWKAERISPGKYGFDALISFDDPACRAEVFRVLREYADVLRLKEEDDDLTEALTGHDPGGHVSGTLDEQKKSWFSVPPKGNWDFDLSLALSIDRPDAYERFLALPFPAFQEDFFRRNRLDGHPLFRRRADRVYIGNSSCFRLFPERLSKLLKRGQAQGVKTTVVLPPVRESRRADLEKILAVVLESPADEIAVNDWGSLTLTASLPQKVLLGQQLNRRRKDPRISWQAGCGRNPTFLMQNALNDPSLAALLETYGVRRYEYESCIFPVAVAPGAHSLHLPFFQTNTSHACPLASAWEGSDPGLPRPNRDCAMPCLTRALLYPDGLGLVGRYNSLFGVDREILTDADRLRAWAEQGVDRIVAELL